jgi:hypothetical protein
VEKDFMVLILMGLLIDFGHSVVRQWIFIEEGFIVKGVATHLKDSPFLRGSLKPEAFG